MLDFLGLHSATGDPAAAEVPRSRTPLPGMPGSGSGSAASFIQSDDETALSENCLNTPGASSASAWSGSPRPCWSRMAAPRDTAQVLRGAWGCHPAVEESEIRRHPAAIAPHRAARAVPGRSIAPRARHLPEADVDAQLAVLRSDAAPGGWRRRASRPAAPGSEEATQLGLETLHKGDPAPANSGW
jgi:hypothetical protein